MANPNPLLSTRHLLTSLISTIASSTQQDNQSDSSNPLSSTTTATPISQNTKSAFLTLHSLFPHDFLPALDLLDRGLITRFVLARQPNERTRESVSSHEEGRQPQSDLGGGDVHNNESREERRPTTNLQGENQLSQQPHPRPQPQTSRPDLKKRKQTIAYQVRSAQRTTKTFSTSSSSSSYHPSRHENPTMTTGKNYGVHLKAWNCSCPAFAFAALPVDHPAAAPAAATATPPSCETVGEDSGVERGDGGGDEAATATATATGGYALNWDRPASTTTIDDNDDLPWLGFGGLTRGEDVPVCKHMLACVVVERCPGFEALVEEKEVGVEEIAGWAAGWGD